MYIKMPTAMLPKTKNAKTDIRATSTTSTRSTAARVGSLERSPVGSMTGAGAWTNSMEEAGSTGRAWSGDEMGSWKSTQVKPVGLRIQCTPWKVLFEKTKGVAFEALEAKVATPQLCPGIRRRLQALYRYKMDCRTNIRVC